MIRRVCAWTAACAVVLSGWAAVPAAAEELPAPQGEPATAQTPATPPTDAPDGGIDDGEVTRPDPEAPAPRHARVLVMGDSISAGFRYSAESAPGRPRAWWSHVAEAASLPPNEVMLSAESGSGLLMRGQSPRRPICTGSTFIERLGDVTTTRPDILVVEVGRNDVRTCRGLRPVPATSADRRAAASRFFSALTRTVDAQGISRSNVYVLSAWGSAYSSEHVEITQLYEAHARNRGFAWVPVPAMPEERTVDRTHPDAIGAKAIGTAVLRGSDIVTAIRSHGTRHAPAPSGTSVRCVGVRACRAAGVTVPATGTRRVWGHAPGTAAHYVAQTLTARGPVAPVLGADTPRAWRAAARAERAATAVAHPRPGDVAWWHTAPASVGRATGHVAKVHRVAADNSWVVVTDKTTGGTFRAVRYSGADLPRAYLRFSRADGDARGLVSSVSARRGSVTVTGRAVDSDAPQRAVRLRVTVTQRGRTWTRTTPRTVPTRFSSRFAAAGLRAGTAKVRVVALNVPGTRGGQRTLATRVVAVR